MTLVRQPTKRPTRKWTADKIAVALMLGLATVIVELFPALEPYALDIQGALVAIVPAIVSYFTWERAT